jgi:hypothetical protein
MKVLDMLSILGSVAQPPSRPECMYPEQWDDPAAIFVDDVPRYPGSYAWNLSSQKSTGGLRAFLDCF